MDINTLVKITSRARALDILALLHRGVPGRQAALLSECGAGRTAFTQSLLHLVEMGLLERNPGHGHPLRPEFRLTMPGVAAAVFANKIVHAASDPPQHILLRRAWTVPILVTSRSPQYFSQIKRELTSITDRALSHSLKQLEHQRWIERRVDLVARPPRSLYQVVNAGREISHAVDCSR